MTRHDEPVDVGFLRGRIEAAVARRRTLFPGAEGWRAVHGESALLPGLFVDCYADGLTVQTISEAMTPAKPKS